MTDRILLNLVIQYLIAPPKQAASLLSQIVHRALSIPPALSIPGLHADSIPSGAAGPSRGRNRGATLMVGAPGGPGFWMNTMDEEDETVPLDEEGVNPSATRMVGAPGGPIRASASVVPKQVYKNEEQVSYWSENLLRWFPAYVTSFDEKTGNYNVTLLLKREQPSKEAKPTQIKYPYYKVHESVFYYDGKKTHRAQVKEVYEYEVVLSGSGRLKKAPHEGIAKVVEKDGKELRGEDGRTVYFTKGERVWYKSRTLGTWFAATVTKVERLYEVKLTETGETKIANASMLSTYDIRRVIFLCKQGQLAALIRLVKDTI